MPDDIGAGDGERINRSIPAVTIIPVLGYPDVAAAVAWLTAAFGFRERLRIGDHRAQLTFGAGALVVAQSEAAPAGGSVMVRVSDADAHATRARRAGARIEREPADHPYGERQYSAVDPWGHAWTFTETIADVDPAAWGGTVVGPA
jgi:uncharacterized glyoxalase superfamily protein PhnB